MKKIILSMTLIGLLGSTALMAADTQSLTRATVKLIKANSETQVSFNKVFSDISNLQNSDLDINSKIVKSNSHIDSVESKSDMNGNNIIVNQKTISDLAGTFKAVEAKADKALITSEDTRRILSELSAVSTKVEEQSALTSKSNETMTAKTNSIENNVSATAKEVEALRVALSIVDSRGVENSVKIKALEKRIDMIGIDIANNEVRNFGRYEELSEKIKSMKIFYEAEIAVLKAKADRAKPIVLAPVNISGCATGKCENSLTTDEEAILNEYLK